MRKLLSCGHQCTNLCSDKCDVDCCRVMIEVKSCEKDHCRKVQCFTKDEEVGHTVGKHVTNCWNVATRAHQNATFAVSEGSTLECSHPIYHDYSLCYHEYSTSCGESNIPPCVKQVPTSVRTQIGVTIYVTQECERCHQLCTWRCPHVYCRLQCADRVYQTPL